MSNTRNPEISLYTIVVNDEYNTERDVLCIEQEGKDSLLLAEREALSLIDDLEAFFEHPGIDMPSGSHSRTSVKEYMVDSGSGSEAAVYDVSCYPFGSITLESAKDLFTLFEDMRLFLSLRAVEKAAKSGNQTM